MNCKNQDANITGTIEKEHFILKKWRFELQNLFNEIYCNVSKLEKRI